jgi:hypothetical protein
MKICGTNIYMVRGDAEAVLIKLNNPDGSPYNYGIGDTFKLTVIKIHPIYGFEEAEQMFQISFTAIAEDNEVSLTIQNADTASLDPDADYKYDIQWTRVSGVSPKTIIPYSDFVLLKEATV